jgi:N-methylhydantoinase B
VIARVHHGDLEPATTDAPKSCTNLHMAAVAHPRVDLDPITFSVLLSRFDGIADEMTLTLESSAMTSILALARDYSCAIYDSQARQICMFDALPIHTMSMHLALAAIDESVTRDLGPGDVFLCNDPYRGNTHVGDLVVAAPIFVDGQHMFWTVAKGHHIDVGATVPTSVAASARNVWQEGLQIPPVKLHDRGVERTDVLEFVLANLRYPELQRGDLRAQLASVAIGGARLVELAGEYGHVQLERYVEAVLDYADRRMAAAIEAMPDGTYAAETWIDSDGSGRTDVPIRVQVTIAGDHVAVDFAGSGTQSVSGCNGTFATTQGAPAVPFMYYVDADVPHNAGAFRHVSVTAPEGSICLARYPAATAMATIVPSDAMHEVVNKAMARAIPDRVVAGGARSASAPSMSGVDPSTGKPWAAMLFNNAGGFPAARGTDGWPFMAGPAALGGIKSIMIEQAELLYPILIEQMEIEVDSMGFGEWIGGPGIRLVVTPTAGTVECVTVGDGYRNPPFGVLGGTAGIGGGQFVVSERERGRRFYSANAYYTLGPGERRVGVSSGGGGYGNPVDRDVERVRQDVRDGLVSAAVARRVFGVVLDDSPNPIVDHQRTRAERDRLRTIALGVLTPTVPNAATWLAENMRSGDEYFVDQPEPRR